MIKFIPFEIKSFNVTANYHWTKNKKYKDSIKYIIKSAVTELPPLPATIRFTRVGIRNLDSDNLMISFKTARDQIGMLYFPETKPGQADSHPDIIWQYDQMTAKSAAHTGFIIDIEHFA